MQSFLAHTRVVVSLLLYVVGSGLVELAHHDSATLVLHGQPVVAAHECGAEEKHIPIDQARHCLACSPLAQRLSTVGVRTIGITPAVAQYPFVLTSTGHVSEPQVISSGKRGPPLV